VTDRTLHEAASEPQSSSVDLVTHELAHQWFGDLVTCQDWSHLWLNEGFATFWAAVYREHRYGRDEYLNEVREDRERYLDEDRQRYRRPLVTSYYSDPVDLFDRTTYQKGFMVLDMLRYVLGDEPFFRAIAHYAAAYRNQTVVTDDLRKAVEESSGKELGWFFEQWVYKAGYPELSVSQEWDEAAKQVRLIVQQTQARDAMTPLFRMPVDVEFTTPGGKRTVRLEISREREEYSYELDAQPLMTRFDPDGRVLMTVQFYKPAAELLYQLEQDPSIVGRIWAAGQLASASGDRSAIVRALQERLLRDSFWAVKEAAAAALGEMRTEQAREALETALKDKNPRIRQAVVRALGGFFRDEQADRLVRKLYNSERNPVTAAEAAYAVGKIQGRGAREFLEKALRRDSDQDVIRRFALAGLRDLGEKRVWDVAARWAEYGNPTQTRIVAIEAFSRLGTREEKTADLLIKLLDDPNVFIRQRSIRALGEGGFQKAREALNRIARTEVHSETKRAIQRALESLGGIPVRADSTFSPISSPMPLWENVRSAPAASAASFVP
jgi:aminopeptidase N